MAQTATRCLVLAAIIKASSALCLPIFPTSIADVLLPGETSVVMLDANVAKLPSAMQSKLAAAKQQQRPKVRDYLGDSDSDYFAQLLINPSRQVDSIFLDMPILKCTELHLHEEQYEDGTALQLERVPCVQLTCIGRARLQLPLVHLDGVTMANFELFRDDDDGTHRADETTAELVGGLYEVCRSLATIMARDSTHRASGMAFDHDTVELLLTDHHSSLEGSVKARKRALAKALENTFDEDLPLHTAAAESELQLLSYATAALLPPSDRLGCLCMRDGRKRMPYIRRVLGRVKKRLAAEHALHQWAGSRGTSSDRGDCMMG